ncbi:MAG: 1-deoxy-D-xylulose-5-phosphate synthase [Bacteroidales bacterium]|nr:1-deoxy-D-xylulose-5-phosphate synthase [Bacteroidales bacterium]
MLEKINTPDDLRKLKRTELKGFCDELRRYIIETIATHPGHLASSLGVVELTVALHYVFNTPDDKLIWDVGHQAYAHKILTGRKDRFPSIRTKGGLSGFPKMNESEYDAFGTGHSSTSISAALGMAVASKLQGETERQHIAVIGDGSMTGGEAFEALNNVAVSKSNILVILNDNGISIDKSVGGLSRSLVHITASPRYNRFREAVWRRLGGDSDRKKRSRNFLAKMLFLAKSALLKRDSNLFESLGLRYFGPIDGHDIDELVTVLDRMKHIKGPKLLHIVTKKGKGLLEAERNPIEYHAPGMFDPATGKRLSTQPNTPLDPNNSKFGIQNSKLKYQEVFGHTIIELAEKNPKIVGITPAMPTGCSLNLMMERMPDRAFDVGIAEQHAVTFAAGLASQGMVPFCNIYSSFMQRAYDQVIHDVALQKLNVVMCLDRAGLVGEDGATHHGMFDLAYLRPIPNLTICAPLDERELRNMMYTAQLPDMGPFVIRYPRGAAEHSDWHTPMEKIAIGRGRCLRRGDEVAILTLGPIGNRALEAAERLRQKGVSAAVYDMRFLKPIDTEILDYIIAGGFRKVVTVEDGVKKGGLGSAVVEYFEAHLCPTPVTILGLPDRFIEHGSVAELHRECGLDIDSIVEAAL